MKVLHLLVSGSRGGVEALMRNYSGASKNDNIFIFAWGMGQYGLKIRENGCTVYSLNCSENGNIVTGLEIISIYRKTNPDFVVIHFETPLLRFVSLFMNRNKVIIYQHCDAGMTFDKGKNLKKHLTFLINRITLRRSNSVIAISNFVKNSIISSYGIFDSKISVVYNGVKLDSRDTIALHEFDGIVHLGFIGRLVEEKGIQVTLEAVSKINVKNDWDFTIVGDGDYRKKLETRVKEFGLVDKVIFKGELNDISSALMDMDIFVHSCTCEEGFGMSVVEAMTMGKVCIVSKSGALPEIITDKFDGYIVEKNNVGELCRRLEYLIDNPGNWPEIQKHAIMTAGKYTFETYASNMDCLLDTI